MNRFSHLRKALGVILVASALALPALQIAQVAVPQVANASASATQTRFANFSSYPIISLIVDNVQRIPAGQVIPAGGNYTIPMTVGSHTYHAANGFQGSQMYTYGGSFSQQSNVVGQVTFRDPTIYQLLTRFASTGLWQGSYYDNNGGFHLAAFRFTSGGTWKLYTDNVLRSTGTYSLVSTNFAGFQVTFTVGGYTGTLSLTGGYFMMRNGPASWPLIQYVYQGA